MSRTKRASGWRGKWSQEVFFRWEKYVFFDDGDDLINWGIDHVGEKRELL